MHAKISLNILGGSTLLVTLVTTAAAAQGFSCPQLQPTEVSHNSLKNSISRAELDLTNRQLERFNSNVAQIFTPANPVSAVHATSSAELQLDSHQLQHPNLSAKLIGNKSTREAAELAESNGSLDELRDDDQLLVAQNAIDQLLAGLSSNKAASVRTSGSGSGSGFNGVLSYNYDRPEAHFAERPRQQSSGYRSTPGARQPYFSRSSNDQGPRGYNAVLAQRASSSGYNLSGNHDWATCYNPQPMLRVIW